MLTKRVVLCSGSNPTSRPAFARYAAMADVIPSTMPPKLPPQTKAQVLAWFFGIAGVSFSVPLLWVITVRFVAHADVILGLGATILSLLMLYTNIRLRKWVKRTRADFYDIMLAMDWIMFGSVCTSLTNNVSLLYYEPKPMLGDLGFYLLPEILPSDPLYVVSDIFVDCLAPMVLIYCVFIVKDPYERSVVRAGGTLRSCVRALLYMKGTDAGRRRVLCLADRSSLFC